MVKGKKSKQSEKNEEGAEDERFSAMHSLPTFKKGKKDEHKVKLDPRFSGVLTDERFRVPGSKYDQYGRKKDSSVSAKDELSAFYTFDNDEEGEAGFDDDEALLEAEEDIEASKEKSAGKKLKPKPKSIKRMRVKPGEKLPAAELEKRLNYLNRMARGELDSDVSSSESSDEEEEAEEDMDDENEFTQYDHIGAPGVLEDGNETSRLAVTNLDWDHMSAQDVLLLFESFLPAGGAIKRVTVYPSDYGLEKLKEEEKFGPRLWDDDEESDKPQPGSADDEDVASEASSSEAEHGRGALASGDRSERVKVGVVIDSDDDSDIEEEEEGLPVPNVPKDYDQEKLRQYELQRLKYYFAIAKCDSVDTAKLVYKHVDGMEWEHSSTTMELSFVPADLSFAEREVRDACNSVEEGYIPPLFVTKSKQQTKVKCSWDEEDPNRIRAMEKLNDWENIGEQEDVSHLIAMSDDDDDDEKEAKTDASSSDDDDDDEKTPRKKKNKFRQLLLGDILSDDDEEEEEDEQEEEVEYTFLNPEKTDRLKKRIADKLASKDSQEETPFEETMRKYREKKKDRRRKRLEEEQGLQAQGNDGDDGADPDDDFFLQADDAADETVPTKTGKGKKRRRSIGEEEAPHASDEGEVSIGVLDGDESEGEKDYDMRAILRTEKMKGKKLKGRRKRKEEKKAAAAGLSLKEEKDTFQVDTKDDRFAALVDGDASFAIDPTSSEFKNTSNMRRIISEQKKRRKQSNKKKLKEEHDVASMVGEVKPKGADTTSLVEKLKRRSIKKPKQKQKK